MRVRVSIVICSLRKDSLQKLLDSISAQTFRDFEVVLMTDYSPLIVCKNEGILKSSGDYILFLDDDVTIKENYLENAVNILDNFPEIGGLSGKTKENNTEHRDSLKYKFFKPIYRYFFMGGARTPDKDYCAEVDFLEPSNYIVRRKFFSITGGFRDFEGVAEWSDVDFFYSLRGITKWMTTPMLQAEHTPEDDDVYRKRFVDIWHRYRNFLKFKKHLKPGWKLFIYTLVLRIYFWLKQKEMI